MGEGRLKLARLWLVELLDRQTHTHSGNDKTTPASSACHVALMNDKSDFSPLSHYYC